MRRSRRRRTPPRWFYGLGGLSLVVALAAAVEYAVLEPTRTEERRERLRHERRREELIWGIDERLKPPPARDLISAELMQGEREPKK